jgi:hypothetical protein
LDLHLASRHDWDCLGHLLDRYVDLEEMLQQTQFCEGTASGTFGSPYAVSEPTPDISHSPGDQQSGHQVKCVYPYSYQHLMKKLPEERERYWNNIRSNINDEF